MVGEQGAEVIAVPVQFGELAHPLQVRRPLGVQVSVGRPVEHQRQHHLGEQLALQVGLGRDRLGQPPVYLGDAVGAARALAEVITAYPRFALAAAKAAIRAGMTEGSVVGFERERALFAQAVVSQEGREGVAAFLSRRRSS